MVVQVTGHKYAHCRRQRTIGIASVIDVGNELSCWRPDLTGDLPKPKIKRVFIERRFFILVSQLALDHRTPRIYLVVTQIV